MFCVLTAASLPLSLAASSFLSASKCLQDMYFIFAWLQLFKFMKLNKTKRNSKEKVDGRWSNMTV